MIPSLTPCDYMTKSHYKIFNQVITVCTFLSQKYLTKGNAWVNFFKGCIIIIIKKSKSIEVFFFIHIFYQKQPTRTFPCTLGEILIYIKLWKYCNLSTLPSMDSTQTKSQLIWLSTDADQPTRKQWKYVRWQKNKKFFHNCIRKLICSGSRQFTWKVHLRYWKNYSQLLFCCWVKTKHKNNIQNATSDSFLCLLKYQEGKRVQSVHQLNRNVK